MTQLVIAEAPLTIDEVIAVARGGAEVVLRAVSGVPSADAVKGRAVPRACSLPRAQRTAFRLRLGLGEEAVAMFATPTSIPAP